MQKIGKDIHSKPLWENLSQNYVDVLDNPYHKHRLEVIIDLIPEELFLKGSRIIDFGCGDGVLFPVFLEKGVDIFGIDISENMIELGKKRLSQMNLPTNNLIVAGVNYFKNFESNSLDGILSFNTLAYLTDEEEKVFYTEAQRTIKPNGFLAVSHSNELFDLYTFNRYTVEFFKKNLIEGAAEIEKIKELLTHSEEPTTYATYNVRENPLAYKTKLQEYGFAEIKQHFSNMHSVPPLLSNLNNADTTFKHIYEKEYPSTLNVAVKDRWKLMLKCSTYMSLSQKKDK